LLLNEYVILYFVSRRRWRGRTLEYPELKFSASKQDAGRPSGEPRLILAGGED
jgi:hypothetical protein